MSKPYAADVSGLMSRLRQRLGRAKRVLLRRRPAGTVGGKRSPVNQASGPVSRSSRLLRRYASLLPRAGNRTVVILASDSVGDGITPFLQHFSADRLNVINFAGLFSGTAIAASRSVAARLTAEF